MASYTSVKSDYDAAADDLEATRVAGYRSWPLPDGTLTNVTLQYTVNYTTPPSLSITLQSDTYNGPCNLDLLTADQVLEAADQIQIYEDWFDGTITDLPASP